MRNSYGAAQPVILAPLHPDFPGVAADLDALRFL
jgi:hypothetical protein